MFQAVLKLHQLFLLIEPEGEFLPPEKQKWRPNIKVLPHAKSTKVSTKVFSLLLESSCFNQYNPWIKIFRGTFSHTRKSLISQHNNSEFASFPLIFIASLRCSLLSHVADLSGPAAARAVAGGHSERKQCWGWPAQISCDYENRPGQYCWVLGYEQKIPGWGVFSG